MRRLLKAIVGLLVVGGLGYAAWLWLRPRPSAASLRVQTFQAESTVMEDVLVVAGLVKPAITIELRAEASGLVESVSVKEGDRVAAGQELVRLDSRVAQSSLEQAEANLRQAQLQDAATKLDLDEDSVELKKRTFERSKSLFEGGLLASDQLEIRELDTASPCAGWSAPNATSKAARPESSR